jgi:phosphatidate cytidylyltransferase
MVIALAALAGLSVFEFYAMLRSDSKLPNELIGTIAAALYPPSYALWGFNGALTLTLLFAVVLLVWYVNYIPARITDVAATLFGALYTGLLLTSLVPLYNIPADAPFTFFPRLWGGLLVFAIVFSTWANDAAALIFGSRFGKHKLAPRISPAKTWEGLLAGMVLSIVVWCLIPLIPDVGLTWPWAVATGVLCGLAGILGDLVESRIKRSTGHKDSGKLLPGHGGFLDRCDSLFLVAPVAYLVFKVAGLL